MTRLSQLTRRNFLIATHDALATAFALLASFYLRFEGGEAFFDRLPLLLKILPFFVAFSVVICYVFNLTTTKWRFISLPDALNILRVATVLTVALIVLDYAFIFAASSGKSPVLFGRVTIVLYWFLQVFCAKRAAFRLSLFPLFARPPPCPDRRGIVDPVDRPRRRCRGAAARDRERRGQAALAGRRAVAIGRGSRAVDPQRAGARRDRRCRGCHPRLCRRAANRFRGSS